MESPLTLTYLTRDFIRGFHFVFVNCFQSEKGLGTSCIYLILSLCLKFYVCSRFFEDTSIFLAIDLTTTMGKIFEISSSFPVKSSTTGKSSTVFWLSCSNFRLKLCLRPHTYKNCLRIKFEGAWSELEKKMFLEAAMDKIFEINSSFRCNLRQNFTFSAFFC